MNQQQIHQYLKRYFTANQCDIIEEGEGHLSVQLTVELDKELMNRPFYWHYLERTGGTPQPMRVTFITDETKTNEQIKGEKVHFGSPRLHQIFASTRKFGRFIRLYEQVSPHLTKQTSLYPWLCMNFKISYQCDRKKDLFLSMGLNLINGTMVQGFHDLLVQYNLTPKLPDFTFTLSPIIMPISGMKRIEHYVLEVLHRQSHDWANEARKRWEKDLALLNHFYEEYDEKPESYYLEQEALQEQYEPKIVVQVVNGGIFYLTKALLKPSS
ncbi:MAG: YqhG family protein [Bacillus sp. (in: Bacteria)]|nr:YqhG family protein [Bacillus sp. (in: firmicutes)]